MNPDVCFGKSGVRGPWDWISLIPVFMAGRLDTVEDIPPYYSWQKVPGGETCLLHQYLSGIYDFDPFHKD